MNLQVMNTIEGLDAAVARSSARPVLLFKHSATCGTSAYAHDEIESLLSGPPLAADTFVVTIQSARAVSNAIAARFGVRHESPQILLIKNAQVAWHASHFRITAEAISEALRQHVTPGGE